VGDKAYRRRLSDWVDVQWREKDVLIEQLLSRSPMRSPTAN
jgi:hypothetical protein